MQTGGDSGTTFAKLKHASYTQKAASSKHTSVWQQRNAAAPCTEPLFNTTLPHGYHVTKNSLQTSLLKYAKQNAGRIHSVRIDNSTFERVEEFKYLGTTLTNQNSIAEEIESRLRPGNACHLSVQNLLSSRLLSKNLKIKIYREL